MRKVGPVERLRRRREETAVHTLATIFDQEDQGLVQTWSTHGPHENAEKPNDFNDGPHGPHGPDGFLYVKKSDESIFTANSSNTPTSRAYVDFYVDHVDRVDQDIKNNDLGGPHGPHEAVLVHTTPPEAAHAGPCPGFAAETEINKLRAAGFALFLDRGMPRCWPAPPPEVLQRLKDNRDTVIALLANDAAQSKALWEPWPPPKALSDRCRHCDAPMGWPEPRGVVLGDGTAEHHTCRIWAAAEIVFGLKELAGGGWVKRVVVEQGGRILEKWGIVEQQQQRRGAGGQVAAE
jgi:hypothetical protein